MLGHQHHVAGARGGEVGRPRRPGPSCRARPRSRRRTSGRAGRPTPRGGGGTRGCRGTAASSRTTRRTASTGRRRARPGRGGRRSRPSVGANAGIEAGVQWTKIPSLASCHHAGARWPAQPGQRRSGRCHPRTCRRGGRPRRRTGPPGPCPAALSRRGRRPSSIHGSNRSWRSLPRYLAVYMARSAFDISSSTVMPGRAKAKPMLTVPDTVSSPTANGRRHASRIRSASALHLGRDR